MIHRVRARTFVEQAITSQVSKAGCIRGAYVASIVWAPTAVAGRWSRTRQLLGTRILFGIRYSSCVSQATWGQVLAYSVVQDGSDLVASERQAPWTDMPPFSARHCSKLGWSP